jgi:AraC family transcriptional regulator
MLQQLNQLMDEIDSHLTEELSIEELARTVGLSAYHLKRTFLFLSGMTLLEYIRNRKLACANQDLLQGEKVTEVAFKYGYQSVEGFSRAFREWSGYLPSEISKRNTQKTFPKLSFFIDIQGGISMEVKIKSKEAFRVVGVSNRVPIQFEGTNQQIIELAQTITPEQRAHMHELGNLYPNQVVNVSYGFEGERLAEQGTLQQLIGFLTTKEPTSSDLDTLEISAHTWAIFPNKGPFPETLQQTWARIFSEWLPSSNYELVDAPEISFTNYATNSTDVYSEIWIAVKAK